MDYQILNGNELIIQGGLEAGFSLYTGYPGSPLAEYFNILYQRKNELHERGIRVVIANSEANAAAMASGAKQAGRDCMIAMKSMGLHVASDALSVGNFSNPHKPENINGELIYPGTVVVVGDDPWSMSTSTAADSRYLYKHLHIPFLEPSTPSELKDWISHALDISKRTSLYQGLLLTTHMAEGGGRVAVNEYKDIDGELINLDPSDFDLSKNVMVPPNSLHADVSMIKERFPKVQEVLKSKALDKTYGNLDSKVGFISSGVVFETLKQVLEEDELLLSTSLYKIACSYPLVEDFLLPYLRNLDTLIVVEEKRGFLEGEIRSFCQAHGINLKIEGKEFSFNKEGFPAYGGLSYEIVKEKVHLLIKNILSKNCEELKKDIRGFDGILPKRLPTFCPGCPHRETLSLLKDLRGWLKSQGIDLITHGDVGCYSLSFLPPFKEMHNLSAMGQGGALGAGLDLFTKNPSVVLMGDSTFFHSGLTDISNSMQMDHDITYILLDNDNTAMTGHQMTPRSGVSVEGKTRPRQSIESVVRALGVNNIIEVNPSDRYFYQNIMRDFIKKTGVKVIISNKECALTYGARHRKEERQELKSNGKLASKSFYQINHLSCEDCRVCVENTGCPGLSQTFDAYGSKVSIDPQICVADSYCTKLKACPSFELVNVIDYLPPSVSKDKSLNSIEQYLKKDEYLPEYKITFDTIKSQKPFHMVVTGVGGSGITTISKIISKASIYMGGHDDLDLKFMDQKGLAQRNGNVTGHLTIVESSRSMGAVTPLGAADLLVSTDLLDGSSKLEFLSSDGVAIFDSSFQVPLSILLDQELKKDSVKQTVILEKLAQDKRVKTASFKKYTNRILGKDIYASSMILGYAYQMGLLPFSSSELKEAFALAIKSAEVSQNIKAFDLGRILYVKGPEDFEFEFLNKSLSSHDDFISLCRESISQSFLLPFKTNYFLSRFDELLDQAIKKIPFASKDHLAQMIHDQFIYNRGSDTVEFISAASSLSRLYNEKDHQEIALRTLAKTYFVKDEVFIAHQMISPLINAADHRRYNHLGRTYKKKRINRPSFDIFNKRVEFDISPKDWMLKIMRHMKVLRPLLKSWHRKERDIALEIRSFILSEIPSKKLSATSTREALKTLENIKGYREVRYLKASKAFSYLRDLS